MNYDEPGARLYLDLLKRCLTRELFPDEALDHSLTSRHPYDPALRAVGRDWPSQAETMVGRTRLDNLQECIIEALREEVPGDLVETGVWRGGCGILMSGVLRAFGDTGRQVWMMDSFQGLPAPAPSEYPQDLGDTHVEFSPYLAVSLEQVRDNFRRYGLLDHSVRFLPGWFRETLPSAPVERIAVLRLDGDMYESTYQALMSLYPRVSAGGFVIIDDYGALPNCRAAVEDFRTANAIVEPMHQIDWTGVYWKRYG